jgi:type I restriction enzyme S subunit
MSKPFRLVALGELANLRMGGTPSRAELSFWANGKSGHPWVSIADLRGKYLDDTVETITASGARSARLQIVPAGVPIMSFKLSLGKASIPQLPVYTNEAIVALTPKPGRTDASWLYHAVPQIVRHTVTETAVKGQTLNLAKLNKLPIPTPRDFAEQRRIAEILDAADERISRTEAVIAKLMAVESAVSSLAWEENSEWLPLAKVAAVESGLTLGSEPSGPSSVELPYLRVANVQDGHIDTTEVKTIRVLRSQVARYVVALGDVLLTEGGDFDKLGRGAVWDGRIQPCLHQNHIFRIRCRHELIIPEYLALYTASTPGRRYFLSVAKQTTNLASINSTQLKAMPVPLLATSEQERMLQPVRAARAEITAEQAVLEKARMVKKGLMDDLLTGKFRVGEL